MAGEIPRPPKLEVSQKAVKRPQQLERSFEPVYQLNTSQKTSDDGDKNDTRLNNSNILDFPF